MRSLFAASLLVSAATIAVALPAHAHETNLPATAHDVDRFIGPLIADAATADAIKARCDDYITEIERRTAQLEAETGPATIDGTLQRYDDIRNLINSAGGEFTLYREVMLDDARRNAAAECEVRLPAVENALLSSRPVYDRLKAIDLTDADAATKRFVERDLAEFERAGIAASPEKRAEISALKNHISEVGTKFDQNIASGRKVVLADPAQLKGLPQDYIDAHPVNAEGKIEISTDYPDSGPLMQYAEDEDIRRAMAEATYNRAYPENTALLADLFKSRKELATLLGRPDFATLALEDKMLDTPAKVEELMAEAATAARPSADKDYATKLALYRETHPGAESFPIWSNAYLSQQIKERDYALDSQKVRKYFNYNNVRDGILQLSEDLFAIDIRPWDTPTWHEDVETYEVYDSGKLIGRFYLDSHPRDGKYSHANMVPLRGGMTGRTVPVAALVMNLPKGGYDTGLMSLDDVETFLHEYGHLMHGILAGDKRWSVQNGITTEWDFVEAPSQMLEEWIYDYDTLTNFAINEQGEKLPRALFDKMEMARDFDKGMFELGQLGYANMSLGLHRADVPTDVMAAARELNGAYSMFEMPDFWHQPASFGHLNGYSAYYYTYLWSRVIAADMFSRFEKAGLRDPATAMAYRRMVLQPGSTIPAAKMVENFLGRPVSVDAFKEDLESAGSDD